MKIRKIFLRAMLAAAAFCVLQLHSADASDVPDGPNPVNAEGILFIPHDDRPISYHQTVDVVEAAGYDMILPPKELLSNAESMGRPDELWQWLEEHASEAGSAVIASDSMLYGGLIPSRKHEVPQRTLNARLARFEKLHKKHPDLKIYVFDSLMRTPTAGVKGNIEEPEYYVAYGADMFQHGRLADKQEISGLSHEEQRRLSEIDGRIPPDIMQDWAGRRAKNLAATKRLVDFTESGVIDYLIVGRDDNEPLSQTHRENRELLAYAEKRGLPKTKFQSMPGIDEFNILLLNRAIHERNGEIPTVHVRYDRRTGANTVPAFSDEKISASIAAAVTIAGGKMVSHPKRADFVLLVHTDAKGETQFFPEPDGSGFRPDTNADADTKHFAKLAEDYIADGYPVGIADIKFANGSDNALMKLLGERGLLFRLQAYSGWNTATNSTGFALGTGMLANRMTEDARQKLLVLRYLDDWAYQANVKQIVGNELIGKYHDPALFHSLKDKLPWAEARNTEWMRRFAAEHLPHFTYLQGLRIKNPWLRMFECDIVLGNSASTCQ